MGKKLEGNGIWESSRMMIPQHISALLQQEKKWAKRPRPILDEDEQALLNQGIGSAMQQKRIITLTVYGEYENRELTGLLLKVDPYEQTLRLRCSDGVEVIALVDVMRVD